MGSIFSLKIHEALKRKLTVQEEHVAEYTGIISAMEEEVKTITKPFKINKSEP